MLEIHTAPPRERSDATCVRPFTSNGKQPELEDCISSGYHETRPHTNNCPHSVGTGGLTPRVRQGVIGLASCLAPLGVAKSPDWDVGFLVVSL